MEGAKLLGIVLEDLQIGFSKDDTKGTETTEGVEVSNIKSETYSKVIFNEISDQELEQANINESKDGIPIDEIVTSKDPPVFKRQ